MKEIKDIKEGEMPELNEIYFGDCIEVLKKFPDNCVDAIITDAPYGLEFMGKDWDKFKEGKNIGGGTINDKSKIFGRMCGKAPSFYQMSKKRFDKKGEEGENDLKVKKNFNILPRFFKSDLINFQEFSFKWASECIRVLKHGGYLLCFGGTRTYHRMVCGIEDAGFEIRDCIMWIYGSGFPKSLNVGKKFDELQGNKREIVGKQNYSVPKADNTIQKNSYGISGGSLKNGVKAERIIPDIEKGKSEWEGWGTALKPAVEPIVVARKPLSEKNVALNVWKWGTGAINIDECRVGELGGSITDEKPNFKNNVDGNGMGGCKTISTNIGRYPANIIHDGSDEVLINFPDVDENDLIPDTQYDLFGNKIEKELTNASRFFYCAKASGFEKNAGCENLELKRSGCMEARNRESGKGQFEGDTPMGRNNHPTIKPISLMEYLIKLVSRKNAIILDNFMGSGTTALACMRTGRNFIGIEKEKEYIDIAEARISHHKKQTKLNI